MTKEIKNKRPMIVGWIMGFGAVIIYSLINVFGQLAHSFDAIDGLIFASIFTTTKEISASITYFLIGNPYKKLKNIIDIFRKNKKKSMLASIAGICGGAIGFTLTTAGGIYVGSGLASPFYSIEIIIVFLGSKFLFKRNLTLKQKIGILIIFISIALIPILDQVIYESKGISKKSIIGIILIIIGVFFWSIESLIFDKITNDNNVGVLELVFLKQIASTLVCLIFVIPLFSLIQEHSYTRGYSEFGKMFGEHWKSLLICLAAGTLLICGRYLFFMSVKNIGSVAGNVAYNSISFIQLPLSAIANVIDPREINYLGNIHHEYFWVLLSLIMFSIGLIMYEQIKNNKIRI